MGGKWWENFFRCVGVARPVLYSCACVCFVSLSTMNAFVCLSDRRAAFEDSSVSLTRGSMCSINDRSDRRPCHFNVNISCASLFTLGCHKALDDYCCVEFTLNLPVCLYNGWLHLSTEPTMNDWVITLLHYDAMIVCTWLACTVVLNLGFHLSLSRVAVWLIWYKWSHQLASSKSSVRFSNLIYPLDFPYESVSSLHHSLWYISYLAHSPGCGLSSPEVTCY